MYNKAHFTFGTGLHKRWVCFEKYYFVYALLQTKATPAIMEMVKQDIFKTRIYPLPAKGSRSVRLSYETRVTPTEDDAPEYVHYVPASIAEGIDNLSVKVHCLGFGPSSPPKVEQVEGDSQQKLELVWKEGTAGPGAYFFF